MRRYHPLTHADTDAEIEKLLADLQNPPQHIETKSPSDKFFDECIEVLQLSDHEMPTQNTEAAEEEASTQNLIDEILGKIPKDELGILKHDSQRDAAIQQEVAQIEAELAAMHQQNIRKRQIKHECDLERFEHYLEIISGLVQTLPLWSPTKKSYTKIIEHEELDAYTKLYQIMELAHKVLKQHAEHKTGFFRKHIHKKEDAIHQAIVSLDINYDKDILSTLRQP